MQLKTTRAFRTISEAGDELGLQPHVLRFWESKFPQIKPMKRGGGRRFYRPEDIEFLRGIKILLHDEKHPIKDVQKLIRVKGAGRILELGRSVERASKPKPVEEVELIPERIVNYEPSAPSNTADTEILRPISAPPMPATTAKATESSGARIVPVVHSVEFEGGRIIPAVEEEDTAQPDEPYQPSDTLEAAEPIAEPQTPSLEQVSQDQANLEQASLDHDELRAALARLVDLRRKWDAFQDEA